MRLRVYVTSYMGVARSEPKTTSRRQRPGTVSVHSNTCELARRYQQAADPLDRQRPLPTSRRLHREASSLLRTRLQCQLAQPRQRPGEEPA
ncbi:hypothetical protein TSOC_006240 [Tetrabaena socialis]|uniref:Uncharacterized protein n=1 Tax=Tetrabaena socialis TaxID=47790 RepID=A0A2J8A4B3_9CHLO|nr:hypothetical protein TSOC_006240 [Tetrabaena socialis]|eukprot:PNH07372.1 hypothetical protein TSOC_006240 [Tetrabaena socialis]